MLVPEKKEAISDLQPRSALKSDARQSATSVVAATAGSMMSSLSGGMEHVESVAVLNEVV